MLHTGIILNFKNLLKCLTYNYHDNMSIWCLKTGKYKSDRDRKQYFQWHEWFMTYVVRTLRENTRIKQKAICPRTKPIIEPRYDKTNKMSVRPGKTQISLGIRPVCSEFSLCAQWVAKDPSFLHADSEDSDQTGRMPRLIWVFGRRTLILLFFSCRGSYLVSGLFHPYKLNFQF